MYKPANVSSVFFNRYNLNNTFKLLLDTTSLLNNFKSKNISTKERYLYLDMFLNLHKNNIIKHVFLGRDITSEVEEFQELSDRQLLDIRQHITKDIINFIGIDLLNIIMNSPEYNTDHIIEQDIYKKYIKNVIDYSREIVLSINLILESDIKSYMDSLCIIKDIEDHCEKCITNLKLIDDRLNTIVRGYYLRIN